MTWAAPATSPSRSSTTASSRLYGGWGCSCPSSRSPARTPRANYRSFRMVVATPPSVLIVEDDPGIAELERLRLEEAGYQVRVAGTAAAALALLGGGPVDLILLDYRLPG